MKISILRPCAMVTSQDGSTTKRLFIGDQVELSAEWEKKIAKSMVNSGFAIEVGGNAEPTETKKRAPRKAPAKKATKE